MAVNATLNLALDRTSGRFSVDEGSTRLYVYDAAIDLSVGGWTRDEVAIGQDGKTMYEPYFQIVCGSMVLAEAKLNGVELPSCAGLMGQCSAVVFSPTFLNIVKNGPEERRRFLDAAVCQVKPAYAPLLASYHRLVKQRNSLLRDVQFESSLLDMLDVVDERMAETGEALIAEREAYIERLVPAAKSIHDGFSGGKLFFGYI